MARKQLDENAKSLRKVAKKALKAHKKQKRPDHAERVANARQGAWNRMCKQDRAWLEHQRASIGIPNNAYMQLLHRMRAKSSDEQSQFGLGLVSGRLWQQLQEERQAALAAAGGKDWVKNWWTPHPNGQKNKQNKDGMEKMDTDMFGDAVSTKRGGEDIDNMLDENGEDDAAIEAANGEQGDEIEEDEEGGVPLHDYNVRDLPIREK